MEKYVELVDLITELEGGMDWNQMLATIADLQKAHKDKPLAEQAKIVDNHFKETPALGWLLLHAAHQGGAMEEAAEDHA